VSCLTKLFEVGGLNMSICSVIKKIKKGHEIGRESLKELGERIRYYEKINPYATANVILQMGAPIAILEYGYGFYSGFTGKEIKKKKE
jgi:hypothetical protein